MTLNRELRHLIKATNNHLYLIVGTLMEEQQLTYELLLARAKKYCKLMALDYDEIFGRSRKAQYVQIRAVLMYTIRHELNYPFTTIGHLFKRDHSTIMYHCREVEHELNTYHDTQRIYRILKHGIQIIEQETEESLDYEDSRGVRVATTRQEV